MRTLTAIAAAVSIVGLTSSAYAEEKPRERWYGWQPLTADLTTATAATVVGIASDGRSSAGTVIFALAATAYVTVPPIIHLRHHRIGTAGLSFATRVVLPTVGTLAFYGAAAWAYRRELDEEKRSEDSTGAGLGVALIALCGGIGGMIAATTLDAALYSREPITPTATWNIVPHVARDRVGIAFSGAF